MFDYLRHHRNKFPICPEYPVKVHTRLPPRNKLPANPSGWFYQNQLHCARRWWNIICPVRTSKQRIISRGPSSGCRPVGTDTKHITLFIFLRMVPAETRSAPRRFALAGFVDLAQTPLRSSVTGSRSCVSRIARRVAPKFIVKIPHDSSTASR